MRWALLAVLLAAPLARAADQPAEREVEHVVDNPIQNWFSWSYQGKNAEGGELLEGQHQLPPPFSMQLLNFAIFLVIMLKAAGPSIRRAVRERHDDIAKALAEGARLRDAAQHKLDEYQHKLAGMQGEIEALAATIRAEAEAEKRRLIAEAEARADRMQRDAQLQIDAEVRRVQALLEREVAEAAVAASERILREKTTEADQRAFADRFIKDLKAEAARPQA